MPLSQQAPTWQLMLEAGDTCWGHERRGAGSSTMDPGGFQSLGSPTKRQERVGKNKPTRAEEGNRWTLGELFRAAAWGQRPHTVDTSVPLPLWNKAQDSCPDAGPPPAWGSRPARHPAEPWPGYLAPGRKMNPEQDRAHRAAAAALGDVLPGSREKRPRGGVTTLPNPALPDGMNRAGPDTKTQ